MPGFKSSNNKIKSMLESTDAETKKLVEYLKDVRDNELFREGGFETFEKFCNIKLVEFGGYARVTAMLGEK